MKNQNNGHMELRIFTPGICAHLLATKNSKNYRKTINTVRVERYARDMKAGKWDVNGETVKFDFDENVLDAQHRFTACVKAGVPFTSWCWIGPSRGINIDMGKPRSIATILQHRGEKNYGKLAAVLRLLYLYENSWFVSTSNNQPSSSALLEILDNRPGIAECVKLAVRAQGISPISGLAFIIAVGCNRNAEHPRAIELIRAIEFGDLLTIGSPYFVLRRLMLANKKHRRLHAMVQVALVIKAWNCNLQGRPVKNLSFRAFGCDAESMPRIMLAEGVFDGVES